MADDVEYKLWNMKFYAYVLVGTLALLFMAAGSKHAKLSEGLNPGDLAPRIEIPENGPVQSRLWFKHFYHAPKSVLAKLRFFYFFVEIGGLPS